MQRNVAVELIVNGKRFCDSMRAFGLSKPKRQSRNDDLRTLTERLDFLRNVFSVIVDELINLFATEKNAVPTGVGLVEFENQFGQIFLRRRIDFVGDERRLWLADQLFVSVEKKLRGGFRRRRETSEVRRLTLPQRNVRDEKRWLTDRWI